MEIMKKFKPKICKLKKEGEVVVAVSGYFNPVHIGHIKLFEEAKNLGTRLIVIVNNDFQIDLKGGYKFMDEKERIRIVSSFRSVDNVVLSVDKDQSVCETLRKICPDIFANGGDRFKSNIPEVKTCEELGIKMVFHVGGKKIRSSSELVSKMMKYE